jgi:dihydrofolate reductase
MKLFNIILAATPKGEIGYKNTIPWKLQGDLKRFKELTMGNICIMGRNTYESLPKPLEGRKMIVVSSTIAKTAWENQEIEGLPNKDGVYVTSSLERALKIAERIEGNSVFVIGGVRLYEEALAIRTVDSTVYLTLVYQTAAEYDAVIPNFSMVEFTQMLYHDKYCDKPEMLFDPITYTPYPSHQYLVYRRLANTLLLSA